MTLVKQLRRFSAARKTPPPAPASAAAASSGASASAPTPNGEQEAPSTTTPSSDPWRHFQTFRGMDEYMDVTLIHYNNKRPEDHARTSPAASSGANSNNSTDKRGKS